MLLLIYSNVSPMLAELRKLLQYPRETVECILNMSIKLCERSILRLERFTNNLIIILKITPKNVINQSL